MNDHQAQSVPYSVCRHCGTRWAAQEAHQCIGSLVEQMMESERVSSLNLAAAERCAQERDAARNVVAHLRSQLAAATDAERGALALRDAIGLRLAEVENERDAATVAEREVREERDAARAALVELQARAVEAQRQLPGIFKNATELTARLYKTEDQRGDATAEASALREELRWIDSQLIKAHGLTTDHVGNRRLLFLALPAWLEQARSDLAEATAEAGNLRALLSDAREYVAEVVAENKGKWGEALMHKQEPAIEALARIDAALTHSASDEMGTLRSERDTYRHEAGSLRLALERALERMSRVKWKDAGHHCESRSALHAIHQMLTGCKASSAVALEMRGEGE